MKVTRLEAPPIHVYNADRICAHALLCMLAWCAKPMSRRLVPLLFEDD